MGDSIKIKYNKAPFTQVPNDMINDCDVSLVAKGLYVFMLSKPVGWNFTAKSVAVQLNIGRHSVLKSLKVLKMAGWILYKKNNDGTGVYFINIIKKTSINNPKSEIQTLPKSEIRTVRNSNPISNKDYISNKDISTTTENLEKYKFELKSKIEKNTVLLELLAMQKKIKVNDLKSKIAEFVDHRISINGIEYLTTMVEQDLFKHFGNWIRKFEFEKIKYEDEFNYFIKMFNDVSGREFIGTKSLRIAFENIIEAGFTGKQLLKAIRNLYSNSDKNWHKSNNYQHATPDHLLKLENVNKYLNIKI